MAGEKLKLQADSVLVPDGHDVLVKVSDEKIEASIRTSDSKTAKNMLKKLARDYPGFDYERAFLNFERVDSYLDDPLCIDFQYGGPAGGRSMVKSGLALLSEVNVDKNACGRALAYLLDPKLDADRPFCYFFDADLVVNRPEDHLFHCVSVVGQPQKGRLLGYVEFFNFARILIHIGDDYSGEAFQETYAVDPVDGRGLSLSVDFNRITSSIEDLFQMPSQPPKMYLEAFRLTVALVQTLNRSHVAAIAVSKASADASKALGLNPLVADVPPELKEEWIRLFIQELKPYFEAQIRQQRR
nr:HNH endonuclease [Janthinobacterium sp. Marseille]